MGRSYRSHVGATLLLWVATLAALRPTAQAARTLPGGFILVSTGRALKAGTAQECDSSAMLDALNALRAEHGSPPLSWSSDLAQQALDVFSLTAHGESQAKWTNLDCVGAVDLWKAEESKYVASGGGSYVPEAASFTQIIWKATTEVGCAYVMGGCDGSDMGYVSCLYETPGNWNGGFEENVDMGGNSNNSSTPDEQGNGDGNQQGGTPDENGGTPDENGGTPDQQGNGDGNQQGNGDGNQQGNGDGNQQGGAAGCDIQATLDAHNQARTKHGAAPLVWDATLASYALGVVNNQGGAEPCGLVHSNGPYGENLAYGTNFGCPDAVALWMEEEAQWVPGTDHFVSGQGHYTQASLTCYQTAAEEWQPQKTGLHVVWKGTTAVGCAMVPNKCGGFNYVACSYNPPGNMAGGFVDNVQ
ncbi:hypothetical protein COHA_009251 [Chlorella ohadii]|uniref:SCP domain-containing protein n=1 Tax=Chlorella ohadii TaxID=2649997 RepID=A0AAD5DII2_9CHLO|nr:hypothetical protein COHA_009251 [Chlorella ohadii]